MTDQKSDEPSGPSTLTQLELKLNLESLFRADADALKVPPGSPIKKVTLCRYQYIQQDIFQELITTQGSDLHARAASDPSRPNLVPEGASATSAHLAFEITDTPEPEEVELLPPHTVIPPARSNPAPHLQASENQKLKTQNSLPRHRRPPHRHLLTNLNPNPNPNLSRLDRARRAVAQRRRVPPRASPFQISNPEIPNSLPAIAPTEGGFPKTKN